MRRAQTRKRGAGSILTKPQHTLLKKVLLKLNPERRSDVYVSIFDLMDAIHAESPSNKEIMTIPQIKEYVESKMYSPYDSAWDMRQDGYTTLIRYAAPYRSYYRPSGANTRRRR